jgi:hypothetical protein
MGNETMRGCHSSSLAISDHRSCASTSNIFIKQCIYIYHNLPPLGISAIPFGVSLPSFFIANLLFLVKGAMGRAGLDGLWIFSTCVCCRRSHHNSLLKSIAIQHPLIKLCFPSLRYDPHHWFRQSPKCTRQWLCRVPHSTKSTREIF